MEIGKNFLHIMGQLYSVSQAVIRMNSLESGSLNQIGEQKKVALYLLLFMLSWEPLAALISNNSGTEGL